MDAITAAYEYCGVLGMRPHGLTLRQLWMMANGKAKQQRIESMQLVSLAFCESIDVTKFLATGQITETDVGKPFEVPPELEEKVQAEIDRLRRENPNLPKLKTVD